MALFNIGIVMKLTDLTARQIRYYEQQGLITPARTSGNQRLFSFNDVDRLLEIKALIEKGVNIAGIKQVLLIGQNHHEQIRENHELMFDHDAQTTLNKHQNVASDMNQEINGINNVTYIHQGKTDNIVQSSSKPYVRNPLTDSELHQILKRELTVRSHTGRASIIQGELSRFFYRKNI